MNLDDLPMPDDLQERPQLAILVALDVTLLAAVRALAAVHREIYEGAFPRHTTESDYWADRLIDLGCQLQLALAKYRSSLEEEEKNSRPVDF
jgi:hypothetical protein